MEYLLLPIQLTKGLQLGGLPPDQHVWSSVGQFVWSNREWLVGLIGASFGLWKWYQSRERAIFRRMEEIISSEERRLKGARSDLVDIVLRPGPHIPIDTPQFASKSLLRILRQRHWVPILSVVGPYPGIDAALSRAVERTQLQLDGLKRREMQLHQEKATAIVLQGAIASARSGRVRDEAAKVGLINKALAHFQESLRVPGFASDAQAEEFRGQQYVRLKDFDSALDAFQRAEANALGLPASRTRTLALARAKWMQAVVYLERATPAPAHAAAACASALNHLAPIAPLSGRELLDRACIYQVHARSKIGLGHWNVASQSIQSAEADYASLIVEIGPEPDWSVKLLLRLRQVFYDDGVAEMRRIIRDGEAKLEELRKQLTVQTPPIQAPAKSLVPQPNA